ncbi:MAG: hypothetical protein WA958_00385 [Tunicatimonas sp.]
MKSPFTLYFTTVALLFAVVSCDNINRESKDVSANAATLSSDTLQDINLTTIDEDAVLLEEETTAIVAEPTSAKSDDDRTYTETEVVQIDTLSTRIVYDIRRRMIEEVDTVGATKTYEIRRKVLRRTVMLDTLTETNDQERKVAYQKGDYKVLDEKVETDTAVEVLDYQQAKREAAKDRKQMATTPSRTTPPAKADQPATTTAQEKAIPSSAQQPSSQSARESTTNATDTTSTSRLPARTTEPSTESTSPAKRPATGTTPSDTTRSESGS